MKEAVQLDLFGNIKQEPVKLAKVKYQWSIYAVTKYYDGGHVEVVINAYTEKQAKFLFYKNYSDYMITGIYRC